MDGDDGNGNTARRQNSIDTGHIRARERQGYAFLRLKHPL